jgi:hypothetical protein
MEIGCDLIIEDRAGRWLVDREVGGGKLRVPLSPVQEVQ